MELNFDKVFNTSIKMSKPTAIKIGTTVNPTNGVSPSTQIENKMIPTKNLIDTEARINTILKDLHNRINDTFDKYLIDETSSDVIVIPEYKILKNSAEQRFETQKMITEATDELISLKIRIGIVQRNLNKINYIVANSKGEYRILQGLKDKLATTLDELKTTKYEISEIERNLANKYKIIESMSYNDY